MADIATNSLNILDGTGTASSLAAQSSSFGLVPVHSISGTINVTASAASPMFVTGTIGISQPVNVDITVSDNISVTSSILNPLFVSSSQNSPILVTGSVSLLNSSVSITGTPTVTLSSNAVTASIAGTPTVSLSSNVVTASISGTPTVTVGNNSIYVTSSQSNPLFISSSDNNAILVSGTIGLNTPTVSISGTVAVAATASINNPYLTVTSSNANAVVVSSKRSDITSTTKLVHNQYSSGQEYVDYTSSYSGTFLICNKDLNRSTLIVFNPTPYNLYIAVGSGSDGPNGFQLYSTSSAPLKYSFILFPSGTYIADDTTLSSYHAGFFVSSSGPGFSPEAVSTKVNY